MLRFGRRVGSGIGRLRRHAPATAFTTFAFVVVLLAWSPENTTFPRKDLVIPVPQHRHWGAKFPLWSSYDAVPALTVHS